MRTHRSEGATEPGWHGPGPADLAHSEGRFSPPFLAPERSSTLSSWRHRHSQEGKPFAPRGHPQAREREEGDLRRRIAQLEGSTHKWRRRKTPSEESPWSTVPCLAPWWGNLLIRPWVVSILRCNRYFVGTSIYHLVLNMLCCLRLATMP
jgi:hypothetical protein